MHARLGLFAFALSVVACAGTTSRPAAPSASERAVADSSNAFAFDLYRAAREPAGNLVLSPASVSTALALCAGGAKGDTEKQIASVLHWQTPSAQAVEASGKLQRRLAQSSGPITLRVANRLFGDRSFSFDSGYLERTRRMFGAPLEPVDFVGATEAARELINRWVADQTERRIIDLLPPHGVDSATRLVLVDAIYFYGSWIDPFDTSETAPAPFFTAPSTSKPVPMMHRTGSYRIAQTADLKMLEIPYADHAASMLVVLPARVDGLAELEHRTTASELAAWSNALHAEQVSVSLPKFELNPASALALSDLLAKLGMPLAFDAEHADFTGIAPKGSNGERLFLQQVFHKAFVKADEKGTEAAAATAVVTGYGTGPPSGQQIIEFNADHPFLFVIRDDATGLITFMGRVQEPSAG